MNKIYAVQYGPATGVASRVTTLVRAKSKGAALKHTTEALGIACDYADQETLARALDEGVKIQDAKGE